MRRTAFILLILFALIVLAFSPTWYPALTGQDEVISEEPLETSL
jgi:hypothetical protein